MKKRAGNLFVIVWRQTFIYICIAVAGAALLLFRLGNLVPGLSMTERAAIKAASSGQAIFENPLFLPHKLMQYVLLKADLTSAFWMRLPSVIIGVLILIAFYRIIRSWYSVRVAVMSTALFACSAWFLHYARLATPAILYAGTIGLIWIGIRLKANKPRSITLLIAVGVTALSIYTPALVWFLIPTIIWQRKLIVREWRKIPKTTAFFVVLALLVTFAPLVYALVHDPSLMRTWLGVPSVLTIDKLLSNTWHLPLWLTLIGPKNPVYWLGTIPLLDVFCLVMFILGIYAYGYSFSLDRVRAIIVYLAIGCGLTILVGPLILVLIMPLMFLAIGTGVALLLQQWFTVFPRNPLARGVGIAMIVGVIVLSCVYNIRHYFIAWPRTPETKQVFQR